MTTLADDVSRTYVQKHKSYLPVVATDIIYGGAAVGDNASGYMRPLVSGDKFMGFAELTADNAAGAAGDEDVDVYREGLIELSVSGAAITDVGRPVYATDDNTFVLTGIGTRIGYVFSFVSSGVAIVKFSAEPERTTVLSFQIDLASVADGDVVTAFTPGFAGRIKSLDFVVNVPVTTAAKATSLNAEIGTTDLTGGVVALTSANCTPMGAIIADTAITAGASFTDTDTVSIEASSTTAFIEGSGTLLVTLGQ